ncbi:response regulator [Pseudoduganella sp. DS3]|uniref:Response regulator n=1 Tax=Pseudoduganella guangdongensis TaxID=2692179 RepID=A0A6N9HHY3_9BURK|nr:response regulator transcription factor [Pseudoduganella guangdongensis]MYN03218.1 response regulator [Pseudoduganella guangdongensis]
MKILLVEDDPSLASGLQVALRRANYTVEHVDDGPAAIQALALTQFDLLVLDLGLPTLDGTAVLQALRARDNPIPVLVLSARDSTRDRVQGLDLGADDYLTKPFELDELLARMRVLLRRRSGRQVNQLTLGELSLNPESLSATWQGRPVELQRLEFMLLLQLAENPQRVFNRAQLEESLYGWGEGAESNTIDVHVHHLRRKITPSVIKTIRGVGYRMGDLAA